MASTLPPLESFFKDCSYGFDLREKVEFYTALSYGSLSIVLYIIEIAVILRSPKLKQPFYYQFIFLAVMNMIFWSLMFFMTRAIPHPALCHYFYPHFKTPTNVFKPIIILYALAMAGQLFSVMLISINRLWVIQWPMGAEKIWRKYHKWILFGVFLLSICCSSQLWLWKGRIDFITPDHLTMMFVDEWPHIKPNASFAFLALVCIIVIIISTAISLTTLWRHPASTKEAEVNLFWTSVGFSITTGVLFVFMVLIYVIYWVSFDEYLVSITMDIRGFVYDINCLVPAWLLLFINRPIKRRLLTIRKAPSFIINIGSGS